MAETNKHTKQLKEKLIDETKLYVVYTVILTLFFCAFTTYRRLILEEYGISMVHYGYNLVQSMILAKLIILGQAFKLGEKYNNRPLIVPTIYKTIVFSLFVIVFSAIEHFIIGSIEGKSLDVLYKTLLDKKLVDIFAQILPMSFFFLFFFAFVEIERALPETPLVDLFFKGANNGFNP